MATRKFSSSIADTLTAAVRRSSDDVDEAVLALELGGDRLDQRIVLVVVLDLATDGLDELEELVRLHLVLADEEDVGEDVLVALMQFVEIQRRPPVGKGWDGPPVSHAARAGSGGEPMTDADRPGTGAAAGGVGATTPLPVPAVVVVGSAARDLADDDPRGWRLGGGVSYSALTTALLGLPTAALIGVDETASTAIEIDLLREAGVDVRLVELAHGPVFTNIERPEGRLQLCGDHSDPIEPGDVPAEWRSAPGWILAPVAAELPPSWADVPPDEALVAVGWQGLLRELTAGRPVHHVAPHPDPIIQRADLVGLSRDDVDREIALADLYGLLHRGASLAVTQGDQGGLIVHGAHGDHAAALELRHYPAVPSHHPVDPTGAGDVFLAALAAARIEPRLVAGRIGQGFDLLLAAAAASLVLEGPGLLGVPTRAAVRARMQAALPRPRTSSGA